MNLHKDQKSFANAIQAASEYLNIIPVFVEKDYWITLALKRLAESMYRDTVVFKGGTSLSKGYKLINRFSEDIDIAIIEATEYSGNRLKGLIRDLEKTISVDLTEEFVPGLSSKGSRFRKTVFEYPTSGDTRLYRQISQRFTIEINSFANPFPFKLRTIRSFITEFLLDTENQAAVDNYGMSPFSLNILDKRRTMIEKIVSLIRFSFSENPIESLAGKIRHFYDLYYLYHDPECKAYLGAPSFGFDLNELIEHDKDTFEEPLGWREKEIQDSPILTDFSPIWKRLSNQYREELSVLAYSEIPGEHEIEKTFINILSKVSNLQ